MKKTFLTAVLLLCSSNGVFAAQAALTQIPALGSSASIKDLRDATNTRFAAAQSNFGEIYTALNGSPWLAQTTAPNIHNVFWIDTSGASPAIKYWDGDSWEVAASGVDGTYTLPTASAETKGGVKIGARLTMTGEVLSADVQTTDISGKQDILVSGANIKTVNGTSVLGAGNLVVGDGGGIAHATSDGNYYASRNGAWANLAGAFVATETDPVFLAWDKDYGDLINTPAIPAALADLEDDATHRIVTDAEKSAWNAKLGALPTWLPSTGPTADNQIIQATGAGTSGWTSVVDGLINDAGTGTDDLLSASEIAIRIAAAATLKQDVIPANTYQPYDADLVDLADGVLSGSKVGGTRTATSSKTTSYSIGVDDIDELYGGVVYVSGAATITAPAVGAGMSFAVVTVGNVPVALDVSGSNRMILDGVILDVGDKAINTSTTGDIITCAFESSAGWYCASGSPDGDRWTDGGQ